MKKKSSPLVRFSFFTIFTAEDGGTIRVDGFSRSLLLFPSSCDTFDCLGACFLGVWVYKAE